jgi:group II intron reverse transcriptase/maturase
MEGQMVETSSSSTVSTKLHRIATVAKEVTGRALTTLAHHIDVPFLQEAYRRTRKDGAVGVDGQTAEAYAEHLEENLTTLLDRFKSGTYHAPPVRRAYIPKEGSPTGRPIAVPTFEDKVLQRTVAMVLEAVYEQEFLDCSYGFRPNRSPHLALEAIRQTLMEMRGGWIIKIDIQQCFDTVSHSHLRSFLDQRIRDGVLRRTIDKWLNAGVLEDGCITHPETGTPQGSGVSPILTNVFLHHVLDLWVERMVKPHCKGRVALYRFADDALIVCASERDARRIRAALPKRCAKYGLTLHPEKTRVLRFPRPLYPNEAQRLPQSEGKSETFEFLGFTHYWGRSRKGYWVIRRKTASARFTRSLKRIAEWCREHRHYPVAWQHEQLVPKLRGYVAYYAITGNLRTVEAFRFAVEQVWRKWLNRRSQRQGMDWAKFARLRQRYPLPAVRVVRLPAVS